MGPRGSLKSNSIINFSELFPGLRFWFEIMHRIHIRSSEKISALIQNQLFKIKILPENGF